MEPGYICACCCNGVRVFRTKAKFNETFPSSPKERRREKQQQLQHKTVNICEKVKQKINAKRAEILFFFFTFCCFFFGFIFVREALRQHKVDDIQRVSSVRLRDCV